MASISEIAPDLYRISTYSRHANLQFNHFLVRDEQPLLFHTGMRGLFSLVKDAVATLMDPASVRWIGFSHFEADECGALWEWQVLAPEATALCSLEGKLSVDDMVAERPARPLEDNEVVCTGKYRFRFLRTPHVPHCWDAGLLFEEVHGTLLCSDLFHQNGNVEPLTTSDVMDRCRQTLVEYEAGPFVSCMPPYSRHMEKTLKRLALLKPKTVAPMHGSAFAGDGEQAIQEYALILKEIFGDE